MAQPYPHLMPYEIPIWERFLSSPPFSLWRIEYDVHLGEGAVIDPNWPAWLVKVVRSTSKKRADVVVETDNELWILEIKVRAGFSCLGQLLGYGVLLLSEWAPTKPLRLGVVCERVAADIEPVLAEFGIDVFVV